MQLKIRVPFMKATAKELRVHSKELLDAVSRGEDVVITFRGKPCARLVPYEKADKPIALDNDDDLFGIWADRNDIESVEEYVQSLRKGRF
jgi:prevent-host-death family protein